MLKQVYKIDTEGFLIEPLIKNFDEDGNCTEELPADIIVVDPPNGLYRAKWTGSEWISSMTEAEYIAALPVVEKEPTIKERLTQLEILTVNTISNQIENKILKGEL